MADETFGPLVDADWLRAHAGDAGVRVIDLRWYLSGKNGADEYAKGHIPGAVFLDLEKDLTARQGPGRHPIPGAGQVERAMRRSGVSTGTRVVVYDDAGGSIAARLWFLLGYYGHKRVAVLDGGLPAWLASGGSLDTQASAYPEGDFTAGPPDSDRVVDKDAVREAMDAGALLLDARAPERYRGETEPVDARPGHIPGARNAFWGGNLESGVYRDAAALRARYEALGVGAGREVVVYCGSGVTACHDLLALERAGLSSGVKLYEGSYSDWARDAELKVATGEE